LHTPNREGTRMTETTKPRIRKLAGLKEEHFGGIFRQVFFSPETTGAFYVRDFAGQKIYGEEHLREIEGALSYELA